MSLSDVSSFSFKKPSGILEEAESSGDDGPDGRWDD